MLYNRQELLNCLKNRLKWYQKATDIETLKIPYENHFDFPKGEIEFWEGAIHELQNTIDMIEHN